MHASAYLVPLFSALLAAAPAVAQEAPAVSFGLKQGLVARQDSTTKLAVGLRVQERAAFLHQEMDGGAREALEFRTRRLRLKLEGFLLSPRLEYKVQFGFSKQDMALGDNTSATDPVLDAIALYRVASRTKIGLGQMRMPGGRQILISDAEWETPDRSLAVDAFSLDRDIGLFIFQGLAMGNQRLNIRAAITQGEGRAASAGNDGLCYAARADWLPLGPFKGDGENTEGDLLHEETPKLAIAVAYSTDQRARRARAQLGPWLPLGEQRTINTLFADMHLKYRGWGWQNECSRRLADGNPVVLADQGSVAINCGWGLTSQLGRMLGKRSQAVLMYSMVRFDAEVAPYHADSDQALVGFNHYFLGHPIKLQGAVSYTWPSGPWTTGTGHGQWGGVIQLQWGIG